MRLRRDAGGDQARRAPRRRAAATESDSPCALPLTVGIAFDADRLVWPPLTKRRACRAAPCAAGRSTAWPGAKADVVRASSACLRRPRVAAGCAGVRAIRAAASSQLRFLARQFGFLRLRVGQLAASARPVRARFGFLRRLLACARAASASARRRSVSSACGMALDALFFSFQARLLGIAPARREQDLIVFAIELSELALLLGRLRGGVGDIDAALGDVRPDARASLAARAPHQRLHRLFGQRAFGGRKLTRARDRRELVQAGAQAFVIEIRLGADAAAAASTSSSSKSNVPQRSDECRTRSWLRFTVASPARCRRRSTDRCAVAHFRASRASTCSRALPRRALTWASSLSASAPRRSCAASS